MYEHTAPHNKIQSRLNRARLMPLALRHADKMGAEGQQITPTSLMGAVTMMQVGVDRLEGVHIYCIGAGQHHADLEFGDMPVGTSNVIGTPLAEPRPNREAAEATAVLMLAGLIVAERQGNLRDVVPPEIAVFEMDGFDLVLPLGLLMEVADAGYLEEAEAARLLEGFRRRMGGHLTESGLAELSPDEVEVLHFAMISMLLRGSPRYPRRWPVT
jgi:hypothetical protein